MHIQYTVSDEEHSMATNLCSKVYMRIIWDITRLDKSGVFLSKLQSVAIASQQHSTDAV